MPLSVQHQHSAHPGLATAAELAAMARHAIETLLSAANYSDHRRARLAVREGVEHLVHALRAEGTSREGAVRRVAELMSGSGASGGDVRYVEALRVELARWCTAAYDGR
jgi:hypothetical protein